MWPYGIYGPDGEKRGPFGINLGTVQNRRNEVFDVN